VRAPRSIHSIWLLLVVLTLCSWGAFELGASRPGMSPALTSAGLLLLAFFKLRLVLLHFMEAATAPVVLRVGLEIGVALAAATLLFQVVAAATF
jgi:Prokaryotic Cytochrome C oxidase subunit IV